MKNMKFIYLYRDGGNYKRRGEVVFSNASGVVAEAATLELQRAFMTDGLFIADQIRIPEVLLYSHGDLSPDDHCFHEFDSVRDTLDMPTDQFERSIGEFLAEVIREALAGWRVFEPYDRVHRLENTY